MLRREKEKDTQKCQVPHGCGINERQRDRGQTTELVFVFLWVMGRL